MATRTRSTLTKKNHLVSPPDWDAEVINTNRAVWQIAAMAGDVSPTSEAVKAKKEADPEWGEEYEKRLKIMKDAISESRGPYPDHIYYDRNRAANSRRLEDVSVLGRVRVDVVSAIEFLWSTFGENAFPEGMRTLHQKLINKGAVKLMQSAKAQQRERFASTEQPVAVKGPSHRDQRLANATKEINRLQTLVYILSSELYGVPPDCEFPPPTLKDDVLDSVKKAGLQGREGLGADGVQTLLEKSFKHFWQLKR